MISKKNKTIVVALVIAACCIGVAGLGAVAALRGNAVASPGEIYVPRGATYRSLADSLEAGGHIRNMGMFDFTARLLGMGDNVRPGYYRLKKGAGYMQLVRMFQRGLQTPVRVTFNNIRTLPQLAGRLAQQVEPDSATLAGIITSDTTAIHYGFTPRTLAAMFIPDTYEFYWTVTPVGLLDRLKTEYDRFWNEQREAKLAAVGLTRVQAVTLASIVFEETKMSDEMPIVAGVYINRLRRGMKLQAATLPFGAYFTSIWMWIRPIILICTRACLRAPFVCPRSRPWMRCSTTGTTTTSISAPGPIFRVTTTSPSPSPSTTATVRRGSKPSTARE